VLRRLPGRSAAHLAVLCRPHAPHDAGAQARAAYRRLAEALLAEDATFRDVARETLLLRDVRRDLPAVLAARAEVLAEVGEASCAPLPAFVEQPPADPRAAFALLASAVVPQDRHALSVEDLAAETACGCEGCARSGARLVRLGDQLSLHAVNLHGLGGDAYSQASDMFGAAERLLARAGMTFRDVVRTWIHLRDIDRDYDALNRARRELLVRAGIERRPASTGVQGLPFADVHLCSLGLQAVKIHGPLDVTGMSTPYLNEAWSYGADFSRGLRLVDATGTTLQVSGTASIDEAGRTAHAGDFRAQAERMLDNVESLLAGQGATFQNLLSGITYLKRPGDAAALDALYRQRGFEGFPNAVVIAPLCRPELLCEVEAVAVLPPATATPAHDRPKGETKGEEKG